VKRVQGAGGLEPMYGFPQGALAPWCPTTHSAKHMRALVIDDSRAIRLILSRTLQELGFATLEAANGKEALTVLEREGPVELALVDWNMPEMNGLEFVQAARARPAWGSMRMMMVTTETEIERVVKALEAGADEYVMKPFTREVIAEKLAILGLGTQAA